MGSEDKAATIWNLLPSFDPGQDDIKEYIAKVKFLDGICPKKDRGMLAPRLAMLCKGTAWHQVRTIEPDALTNPDQGVKHLLKALSAWEESAELKTFELFERAIYKTTQKSDESTQSFVNRLDVAFEEVGQDTTLKSIKAFVLLKQSNLGPEDKKKVLTITNGQFEKTAIENAMRSLSTNVLTGGGTDRKKVYPTNFVEESTESTTEATDLSYQDQNLYAASIDEEDLTPDMLEHLASTGDADALTVQSFEKELTELFQEVPDLHSALLSYQEARGRIVERKRNRGFWPLKGGSSSSKSGKGYGPPGFKGFKKGQSKGKEELLSRIARTHCKRCGEIGHWKAECPLRSKESQANVASTPFVEADAFQSDRVLFEQIESEGEVGVWSKENRNETTRIEPSQESYSFEIDASFESSSCEFALFTEATKLRTMSFFMSRNRVLSHEPRRPSIRAPEPPRASIAAGLTNRAGSLSGFQTNGMAILDTGASRSVVGDEHLQMLLEQLPTFVRDRVKEKPSRVTFRFGNNQIEHSYKQIHIPIDKQKVRMWLVVEVVPKGTPFLLSIQAMKQLGTIMDLQKGSCFLSSLNRSIKLHEGRTGLLMIRLSDLCQMPTNVQSIFGASSESIARSLIEPRHAHPWRADADGEEHRRECDAKPSDVVDHSAEPSSHSGIEPRGSTESGIDDERIVVGSPIAEREDRGAGAHDEAQPVSEEDKSRGRPSRVDGKRFGSLGSRSSSVPTCSNRWETIDSSGKNRSTYEPSTESEVCGSWQRKLRSPRNVGSDGRKSGWDHITWHPIACEQSRQRSWTKLSRPKQYTQLGLDDDSHGSMGTKARDLGKEASGQTVCPSVRDGQSVRLLVPEQDQFARCPNQRFRSLLPDSKADGRAITPAPVGNVEWETLLTDSRITVENEFGAKLLKASKQESYGKKIDLLEVYAQPTSRLAEEVTRQGGRAERFTREHGDLSTFQGQVQLLEMIFRLRPKQIWVAPECHPWCAWNRFNASRSTIQYDRIQQSRELSKIHMNLCALICKIQVQNGRHFTLENPGTSDLWKQVEIEPIHRLTKTVHLDQCRFGLVHPEDQRPMKKYTRLQTTSESIVRSLDGRFCKSEHLHAQIAGSCRYLGERIALSRFAAFYPKVFAKAAAKSILQENEKSKIPMVEEGNKAEDIYPVEASESDHPAKRARIEPPREAKRKVGPEETEPTELTGSPWEEIFAWLQNRLPKSGSVELSNQDWPADVLAEHCSFHLRQVIAGKGMDKYLIGETSNEMRKTICQCRKTKLIDLGEEQWNRLTLRQQRRAAMPSHIMLCLFGQPKGETKENRPDEALEKQFDPVRSEQLGKVPEASSDPKAAEPEARVNQEGGQIRAESTEALARTPVPAWSPQSTNNSGPNFLKLDSFQKSLIQRMHNNLGHPTAEKLSAHLRRLRFSNEVIEGAADYLCQSCSERVGPKLTSPGKLKEPKEFNEVISIDGFEWKNEKGKKFYVVHIFDESTHFHLGKRCLRGTEEAEKVVTETWMNWAGPPETMVHDLAGEFVSQHWKDMLQQNGIHSVTTAAPWQRGRIERHGGTVKEMLSRIDHHIPISSDKDFDYALTQCFQAKNSMSVVKGFSPEQAVLGRARKIPGSICSDETIVSHSLGVGEETQSEVFKRRMSIRTEARKAMIDADNSEAIRRAILRQSRGREHDWNCGELCMIWDKRKAPNMLEKGRWVGPCQVIMHESRTIVWVTHLNRLLRVARENMRSVSLREFQSHHGFSQVGNQERLQKMADQLRNQLKERSGMFQFSDLSDQIDTEEYTPSEAGQSVRSQHQNVQPEEEPLRRNSNTESAEKCPGVDASQIPVIDPAAEEELKEAPAEGLERGEETCESKGDSAMFHICMIEGVDTNQPAVHDRGTLWSEEASLEAEAHVCSFELVVPMKTLEKFCKNPCLNAEVLNRAAKKTHTEVQYRNLTKEEKQQFDQAKRKELQCWIETSTVEPLLRDRIHPSRIMSSKWVLTWKEDQNAPSGRKPKARLVIRGFQDPEVGIVSTESPTLSRDGRMMILQTVSSLHWPVQAFDIKTAFLRGRSDERELAMEPVEEFKSMLQLSNEHVLKLKGNAYGRVDAPLLFYKEFRSRLENEVFEAHPLDNCIFLLRNKFDPSKLDGILGTHVDDGIGGGNSRFEAALERIQKHLPFGNREYGKFKFTGLTIEQQADFSIRINQKDYIHQIDPIDVPKLRRKEPEAKVTSNELQHLRALCGSMQYAAVHSRPDIMAKVSFLQKRICDAKVQDLLEGNRVLKEAKETSETTIIVQPIPMEKVTFASFGDASFASESQLKAQQGVFIAACTKELSENKISDISPMAWHSKQISRVVRSTLSAEAYAMSSSLDKLTWLRCMCAIIKDSRFRWQKPEESLKAEPKALLVTDCKSLYDLVNKMATPNCQEWRTTIEVMLIKQQSSESTDCRWISTAIMIADCLTKPMDSTFMRKVLSLGKFRIYDDANELKNNPNRTFSTRWVESFPKQPISFEQKTQPV